MCCSIQQSQLFVHFTILFSPTNLSLHLTPHIKKIQIWLISGLIMVGYHTTVTGYCDFLWVISEYC